MTLITPNDRIFVAGHRGMAGSAICRSLKRSGYNNLLLVPREKLDLANPVDVHSWFEASQPDVVVLAAAQVGGIHVNNTHPADFLLQNIKIQTHVIESAWRNGVRRLLFLGSSCIYPRLAPQPLKEESLLTGPLEPSNEGYAIAKIAGLKLCQALRQQYGFDAIGLMPSNLYGPGDNYHPTTSHVLPAMIHRFNKAICTNAASVTCWGTGRPRREFLHVDDLGDACVWSLECWQPGLQDLPWLNVGTGVDLSIRELAHQVAAAMGFKGDILWDASKPDGTPKKLLDVNGLAALGWHAQIPLNLGLVQTVEDFKRYDFKTNFSLE